MSRTTTDPIADMLSRIRNAILVRKTDIMVPHSNIKENVAKLLSETGFIESYAVNELGIGKVINIKINNSDKNAKITEIVRLSKPGRRYYINAKEIPIVKRGRGLVILSTSKGLMTGDQAKSEHLGGELICKVY